MLRGLNGKPKFSAQLSPCIMDFKKLISCTGYALRFSRSLNVPEVTTFLKSALEILRKRHVQNVHCLAGPGGSHGPQVISIYNAINPKTNDEMEQTDAKPCFQFEATVAAKVPTLDSAVQTETEIISRQQCEDIVRNLQDQFERLLLAQQSLSLIHI